MNERSITVSDGENFYRIPVSDLPDASADGFYVPGLHGLTIVTNGEELFEIPLADAAEAEADGFRDMLVSERDLLSFAESILTEAPGAAPSVAEGADPGDGEPPDFDVLSPPGDSFTPDGFPPPAEAPTFNASEIPESAAAATVQPEDAGEEGDGSAISKFLLPGHHLGGRSTWQVMLINSALHAVILLFLAMIILPGPDVEILMEITSAFEPKDPVKMEFEAVELEQPVELKTDPVEEQVLSQFEAEDPSDVNIDVSDVPLSIPDTMLESTLKTGPQTNNSKSEMGGRSKAGRASLVARRGGNAASEAAVMQGLLWVARHQYPDGGWSFDHSLGECNGQCSQPGNLSADCRNAATGMALLAMLGAGNTPYEGDFQETVQRGISFMLQNSAGVPAGLDLRSQHASNTGMYTQAIAATALCEVLAMTQHEYQMARSDREDRTIAKQNRATNVKRTALMNELRPAAQAAISFIINAQHKASGGWGYNPNTAGDTSILGWQMMALKSAAHAGMSIPPATVLGANRFLTSVQTQDGWFGYRGKEKKASTTAIGIISRMLSGMRRDHPLLQQGVAHLSAKGVDNGNMYYNYYATQVMLHYGGDQWKKWNEVMRDRLVKTQVKEGHAAGSWNLSDTHGGRGGRLYMTCLCTMTLEVYYRHLPLYGEPEELEAEMTSSDSK